MNDPNPQTNKVNEKEFKKQVEDGTITNFLNLDI